MDDKRGGIRTDHQPPAVGRRIAELAGRQHGVVARSQLRALGLDSHAVRRRVQSGSLHPLHAGRVYAVTLTPLTSRGLYLAAVLAAGQRAALSHRAAADVWGIRPNATWVEIVTPVAGLRLPGISVHRTRVLGAQDLTVQDGIPITSVARTLLDLSAVVKTPELLNAIDRAERLNVFDLDAVVEAWTAPTDARERARFGAP